MSCLLRSPIANIWFADKNYYPKTFFVTKSTYKFLFSLLSSILDPLGINSSF
jgi:hypothetical protein